MNKYKYKIKRQRKVLFLFHNLPIKINKLERLSPKQVTHVLKEDKIGGTKEGQQDFSGQNSHEDRS